MSAVWATVAMTGARRYLPRRMTEILLPDAAGIARAAASAARRTAGRVRHRDGYGLGADATNAEAVAGIFAAKGRPRFNPLICHYPDADAAFAHVAANATARRLAAALWPGPLTLVLPRRPRLPGGAADRRRAGHAGGAGAGAGHGAGVAARGGAAGGGALGQPVRPGQSDHRRGTCWRNSAAGSTPCWTAAHAGRRRIDGAGPERRPADAAAAGRRDAGGDRGADRAGGAWRRARRASAAVARHAGLALRPCPARPPARAAICIPTKHCSRSVRRCPARASRST